MINTRMICRIMGFLLLVETGMLICCLFVSLFYGEDDLQSFAITSIATAFASAILLYAGRNAERQFGKRDGILIVSLSWVLVSAFGMIPYYISGYIPNITNAFFETMSGFTSTGATILDNIESFPHGLLFWRSFTQWIGGLGIVFFTIAVLPVFGVNGLQLFAAEASSFTHDKVHPRIGVTAKWIWSIYLGLTISLTALLCLGGMDLFDSVCHAFGTTSTGGFSTKQSSMAFYNSPFMEYVTSVFMIISGINFMLLLLFTKGKFRKIAHDSELKWYLSSIFLFTALIASGLYLSGQDGLEESFRKALFQVASIQTSTGLVTTDYILWKPVLWCLLLVLMVTGACAGSTSGGIKCIRILLLFKVTRNEFKRLIHPNAVLPVKINRQVAPPNIISSVFAFINLYIIVFISSILLMMAFGVGFEESIGTVLSSIGNMGPGLGSAGPAYSWNYLPDMAKWLLAALMLTGRLELFTVLVIFTRGFWKK